MKRDENMAHEMPVYRYNNSCNGIHEQRPQRKDKGHKRVQHAGAISVSFFHVFCSCVVGTADAPEHSDAVTVLLPQPRNVPSCSPLAPGGAAGLLRVLRTRPCFRSDVASAADALCMTACLWTDRLYRTAGTPSDLFQPEQLEHVPAGYGCDVAAGLLRQSQQSETPGQEPRGAIMSQAHAMRPDNRRCPIEQSSISMYEHIH